MYNKDIKQAYVHYKKESVSKLSTNLPNYFITSENRETELHKDLYDWSKQEILDYFISLKCKSLSGMNMIFSNLKAYTDWCIENGYKSDGQNHYYEIQPKQLVDCLDIKAMKNDLLLKEDLIDAVDHLVNPSDAFIILALYEGLTIKEISEVTRDDLSNDGILHLKTRDLSISAKLQHILKDSCEQDIYYKKTNYDDAKYNGQYKLIDGAEVVRQAEARSVTENKTVFVSQRLRRVLEFLGWEHMTAKTIRTSGCIDMILTLMHENNTTMEQVFRYANGKEIEKRYGKIQNYGMHVMLYKKLLDIEE